MRNTLLLAAVGLCAIGCAGTATTPKTLPPVATVAPPVTESLDVAAFRAELEGVYSSILARDTSVAVAGAPAVDLEAATSIPIPEHRTINSAVRLFSVDMKPSIQASLRRSARYRALIDSALAEHDLPKALAYLPVIESGYVPNLTSRAGAYGIWQFMPPTAREYGLRVDWWVDERADPEKSTRAAAAYLRDLHRMFGDWSLALAAYNCGPGRVRRTLTQAGASSFWELLDAGLLPKETRGYVPTFFATILIASDPETYGFELGPPMEHDEKTIEVRGPLSLEYLAEAAALDEELLRELNPALRRGVVPPGRSAIRVPARAAGILEARADSLHQDDAYVRYATYRVRKGDSVTKLARAFDTKPETILAMNGLAEKARLDPGDAIYVPARAREIASLLAGSKENETYYAVRKGDTLYSIAKKNGLSVAELRDLNDLSSGSTLRLGQNLRVSAPRIVTAGGM